MTNVGKLLTRFFFAFFRFPWGNWRHYGSICPNSCSSSVNRTSKQCFNIKRNWYKLPSEICPGQSCLFAICLYHRSVPMGSLWWVHCKKGYELWVVENEVKTPIIKCVQYSNIEFRQNHTPASTNPKNLERQFTRKMNTELLEYCVGEESKIQNMDFTIYLMASYGQILDVWLIPHWLHNFDSHTNRYLFEFYH